jgi:hypothetical protein
MRRREFITLLGGIATVPLAARAMFLRILEIDLCAGGSGGTEGKPAKLQPRRRRFRAFPDEINGNRGEASVIGARWRGLVTGQLVAEISSIISAAAAAILAPGALPLTFAPRRISPR